MSQRHSEYARQDADAYWTPKWVFCALWSVEPDFMGCEDVAPRNRTGYDFLDDNSYRPFIATNPPYSKAEAFCRHALEVSHPSGKVAMLLPLAFDAAKTRRDLFENPPFKAKYTLTKRIRWENLEQKKNGPSTNHAWFIWDWHFSGTPVLGYLP